MSDDVQYGACVEVLQVVRRSPSGGAFTRQVHADTPLRCARRACASHLLLGSARAPTALRRILHGHIHTPLPACGRTRLGPATRARSPEAAADAETAIVGCGWPVWVAGEGTRVQNHSMRRGAALAGADLGALNVGLRAPPRRAWTAQALALGASRCFRGPDRVHVPPIAHVKGPEISLISLDQLENN